MISVVYRLEQYVLGSMVYSNCHVLCLQIPKHEYFNFRELAVQIVLTILQGISLKKHNNKESIVHTQACH